VNLSRTARIPQEEIAGIRLTGGQHRAEVWSVIAIVALVIAGGIAVVWRNPTLATNFVSAISGAGTDRSDTIDNTIYVTAEPPVKGRKDSAPAGSRRRIPPALPKVAARPAEPEPQLQASLGVYERGRTGKAESTVLEAVMASAASIRAENVAIPPAKSTVSEVAFGKPERAPAPGYPAIARIARIEGEVVLHALIDTRGHVANVQVVSGHPMLAPAATDAVKRWKYEPYLLNGKAVEAETTIKINFILPR
jgi:periplasmic protein TonB